MGEREREAVAYAIKVIRESVSAGLPVPWFIVWPGTDLEALYEEIEAAADRGEITRDEPPRVDA